MIARLLAAIQFLTLFPVKLSTTVDLSDAAIFFPIVGSILGAVAGGLLLLVQPHFGPSIASLLALCSLLLLSGGLHEDGLADVADAVRAGRPREKILAILKDSRIGAYGALALLCFLLLRWQALSSCRLPPVLGLIAAVTLSRTSLVALAGSAPAFSDGLGAAFIRHLSPSIVWSTVLLGAALAIVTASRTGLIMLGASSLVVAAARTYFLRRLGGVNGDCLGATCVVVETVNLLVLVWQPST